MFDRYLEDRQSRQWKRRALAIGSVVAHGVFGLFLFAVTLFTVDEIRPPALAVVFLRVPPPPPPPLPPALGHRHDPDKPKPVVRPHIPKPIPKIVQPTEVKPPEPKPEPAKPEEEDDDDDEGDPEGVVGGSQQGVKGGQLDGVEGGMLGGHTGGVQVPAAPAPAPPPPKVVASFIFDRERVSSPDPHLPEAFLQSHPGQTVKGMYRICVETDGHVFKVETVTSLSGMDQTIIDQVKDTWVYKPQSVPVCTIRVFEFHIK